MKKTSGKGIIQLILSIAILIIFHYSYFKIFNIFRISLNGIFYEIANFIKYVLMMLVVFAIYHGNINSGKSRFNKSIVNSLIYSIASFIVLILITVLTHRGLNIIGQSSGFIHSYNFVNYFNVSFSIGSFLSLLIEAIIKPFLLCVIFPLGISNIIKSKVGASLLAGILYGIIYVLMNYTSISLLFGIFIAVIPCLVVMFLTYLYKTNGNIWTVMITYSLYVLFGIFAINYIVGA